MKRMALVFVLVVFLISGCASTKLIVERTDNKPITLEQIADDRNVCHNVVWKKIMDNDIRLNTKNVYVLMSCGGTDMVPCDHLHDFTILGAGNVSGSYNDYYVTQENYSKEFKECLVGKGYRILSE